MSRYYPVNIVLACVFSGLAAQYAPELIATEAQPVSFKNEIATILLENCIACHGPKKAEGGYRIDSFFEMQKPGDSGCTPIVLDAGATSEILRRITSEDQSERMPPGGESLSKSNVDLVTRWVREGAKFDGANENTSLNLVVPPRVYPEPPASYSLPVPISAMAFSPDGSQLLVGGYHEVTIWSTADATLIRRLKNVGQRVYAIVYLADQKTIAVACGEPGKNGEVRLFDIESGNLIGVVSRTSDAVFDIAVRPSIPGATWANEIAIGSADGLIRIVNSQTMEEIRIIANHADWVTALAFSDDGSRLASASRDKSAKLFDANNGELLASYQGHSAAVRGIAFLPDGKHLFSAGGDKNVHRWEADGAKKIAEVSVGGEAFKLVRGGPHLFVPSSDKRLLALAWGDNKVVHSMTDYQDWVLSTAYCPKTEMVAGGAINGEVRLWSSVDGKLVRQWIAKP